MSVFDEPSRRNQLGVRLLGNEQSSNLLNKLYEVVSSSRSSKGIRGFGRQEDVIKDYIEQITADLYASWLSDTSIYTGYSRSSSAFSSKGAYRHIGKDNFLFIIDSLAEAGLIESHIQDPGLKRKSSRLRCTTKLAQLIEDNGLNWASIIRDPIMDNIVLKQLSL